MKEKTLSMLSAFIDTRKSRTYILGTCSKSNMLTPRFKSRFEIYRISRPTIGELTSYFHKLIPSKFDFQKSRIYKIVESTNCDMKLSIIYIR